MTMAYGDDFESPIMGAEQEVRTEKTTRTCNHYHGSYLSTPYARVGQALAEPTLSLMVSLPHRLLPRKTLLGQAWSCAEAFREYPPPAFMASLLGWQRTRPHHTTCGNQT